MSSLIRDRRRRRTIPAVTDVTSFEPGMPCWVDLASTDPDRAAAFYGALFGWEATEAGDDDASGQYRMFLQRGRPVGGLGPVPPGGQPSAWSVYFRSDDLDATVAAVTRSGGSLIMPPDAVGEAGSLFFAADTGGAAFGVWQPGAHQGMAAVNEHGTFSWAELNTRAIEDAKSFYTSVFGWGAQTNAADDGSHTYVIFSNASGEVAGGFDMTTNVPAEVPPHWLVYFAVDDVEAAAAAAVELGGSALTDIMAIEPGRFCLRADPTGAHFALIELDDAT